MDVAEGLGVSLSALSKAARQASIPSPREIFVYSALTTIVHRRASGGREAVSLISRIFRRKSVSLWTYEGIFFKPGCVYPQILR